MRKIKVDMNRLSDSGMSKLIEIFNEENLAELKVAVTHPHSFEVTMSYDEKKSHDCRKIGSVIYLVGDKLDMEGEEYHGMYELFNMTEEMNSGHSYSTYISDVGILPKSSKQEQLEVTKFLSDLHK